MRKEFIRCDTKEEAQELAPWAAIIKEVEGGFLAFESVDDAELWERQK